MNQVQIYIKEGIFHCDFLSSFPEAVKLITVGDVGKLLTLTSKIVLLSHKDFADNINDIYANQSNRYILHMPSEGTSTIGSVFDDVKWISSIQRPFIISSGDFGGKSHINIDRFRNIVGGINVSTLSTELKTINNIFSNLEKPYAFNLLNGVRRPHRTKIIENLNNAGALSRGLWSYLYRGDFLPSKYRFYFEPENFNNGQCNDDTWPAGNLYPPIYEDTYFSIVTETNFEIPHSYRTEKIYKPLKIGHPFIAVSSKGFYRDLHNLGFKTFGSLIDESFDQIDNNDERMQRITAVILDLLKSDLKLFLSACRDICFYNRQHLTNSLSIGKNFKLLDEFLHRITLYTNGI
jgi:hypothetical protein